MIGTHVQIMHVFSSFTAPLPTKTLADIEANGSTPLLDWSCDELHAVAGGERDSVITSYAKELKAFAHPIFLRWYWEMNHAGHQEQCGPPRIRRPSGQRGDTSGTSSRSSTSPPDSMLTGSSRITVPCSGE